MATNRRRQKNTGYTTREDGTAISIRGAYAEENGKFSEGRFRSFYHVTKRDFNILLSLGLIRSEEWHHTGARFNRSDFYEWSDANEVDYSEVSQDGHFPEGSLAEKYFSNRKAVSALVKESESKPWEYVSENFGHFNIPSFEDYIKAAIEKPDVYSHDNSLNYNLIRITGKGIEDYLSDAQKEERQSEHSSISLQGEKAGSAAYRRELHLDVDRKYNRIAIDSIPEDILHEAYENAYADDIKHNSEVEGKITEAHAKNTASDGKEKVLIRIAELMDVEHSDAERRAYSASMSNLAAAGYSWNVQKRQEYASQIDAVLADIEKKQKDYVTKLMKQGRAERRERIASLPQMFATEKEEMNGRYGWFNANSNYNLPRYYTGVEFKDRRGFNHYNEIKKNSLNIIEVLHDKRDYEIASGPSDEDIKRLRMQKSDATVSDVVSTKDAMLRDELIRRMRESGINVVTNERQAQRALERANNRVKFSGDAPKGVAANPVIYTSYNVDDVDALKEKYPSGLSDKYYHHSTVKYGYQPLDTREGKKERLHITGRLTTDKVDVLVVENPESNNRIPHITLATAKGIKPVASNFELEKYKDKIQPLDDYVDVTFTNNLRGGIAATPVTTPDFKEWFGDWENNSEQASKVVDEQGRPLVVYHGTGSYGFNTFDNKEAWNYDLDRVEKTGIYFTSDKKNAIGYEDEELAQLTDRNHIENGTYSVYLNMRNPLIVDYQGAWWNGRKFNYEVIDENDNVINTFNARRDAENFVEDFSKQHGYEPKINNVPLYSGLKRVSQYVSEAIEKGYDGVICKNVRDSHIDNHYAEPATDYVVLNPNQIKSATNNIGTYRRDSNDIRFHLAEEQPIFISNAMLALDKIKQEKATPEQWLKMLEKNGGIKAGEDRWTGLSKWLRSKNDTKGKSNSLTKSEIVDYLNENMIEVEEVHYADPHNAATTSEQLKAFQEEFDNIKENIDKLFNEAEKEYAGFMASMKEKYGEIPEDKMSDNEFSRKRYLINNCDAFDTSHYSPNQIAHKEMVSRYGDDWGMAFYFDEDGQLFPADEDRAIYFLGDEISADKPINDTRLQLTTLGLTNNREIALTVPSVEPYIIGGYMGDVHFDDAGDGRAVAWVRFGETTNPDGERVLVIDEIQSKRHQEGREKGYRRSIRAERDAVAKIWSDSGRTDDNAFKRLQALNQELRNWEEHEQWKDNNAWRIPDAPFDKNWQELCMKRMLRYAAENGFDRVAWTTGLQQAQRYAIGGTVNDIQSYDLEDKGQHIMVRMKDSQQIIFNIDENGTVSRSDNHGFVKEGQGLSEIVGKALSDKIINREGKIVSPDWSIGENIKVREIEGKDLQIGGEGMKGFYDSILVKFTDKYTKQWGVKTEDVLLPELTDEERNIGVTMHSVPVTEQMRSDVMQGQPMFFKTQAGTAYGFALDGKIFVDTKIATAETPIHEYTHLWAEVLRENNPREWKNIVSLMKDAPEIWEKVAREYPELHSDDEIADEVLAQYSGKRGYEKLMQMQSEGEVSKGALDTLMQALEKLWKKVAEFFRIHYTSKEDVADRVLRDLLSGVNPRQEVEKYLQRQDKQYMKAVERGDEKKVQEIFQKSLRFAIGNGMTPYIAVDGYRGKLAGLARKVKTMDKTAINTAADKMAPLIPRNAVLVPAPSHKGEATDMLKLAKAISRRRHVEVMDVLKSYERERQYTSKKFGGKAISSDNMGIVAIKDIPEGKIPVVIDNVVSTGNTAEACVKALGYGIVVSLADATTAYKHTASLKSAAPVMRNQAGEVIPLSKRFDLSGAKYIGHAAALQKVDTETITNNLTEELKKYNGELLGVQTKDDLIGVHVLFKHHLDADAFAKDNKMWRDTKNVGTHYEFILLNEAGIKELTKRGYKLPENIEKVSADPIQGKEQTSPVQGLEGYTQDEIKDIVESYVQDILDESDIDATIEKVTVIGSRSRNEAKADSDLDILLEYSGEDYPEDAMYNLLHDDENPLEIEGLKVDINPINPHYSLSTEEWLARDARWREEDKKKVTNNKNTQNMKDSFDTAKLQEQAVRMFGKNFMFDLTNFSKQDPHRAGHLSVMEKLDGKYSVSFADKVEIKDGILALYSTERSRYINLEALDSHELRRISLTLDEIKAFNSKLSQEFDKILDDNKDVLERMKNSPVNHSKDAKPYIIHIGTDDRGIVGGEFHVQFTDDNIKLNFDDISKYLKENNGAMRLMDGKPWFDFYDKASAEKFAEQITSIGKNITNTINSKEMANKTTTNEKQGKEKLPESEVLKGKATVSSDGEVVSLTNDKGEKEDFRHVHGGTHDDPALLYCNTRVDVYFYDTEKKTIENIDNEAGIDAYADRKGIFLVRDGEYEEAYRQLEEHDREVDRTNAKQDTTAISDTEKKLIHAVSYTGIGGKEFKFQDPVKFAGDANVTSLIDGISVSEEKVITLHCRNIDQAGATASFALTGREDYSLKDLKVALEAVTEQNIKADLHAFQAKHNEAPLYVSVGVLFNGEKTGEQQIIKLSDDIDERDDAKVFFNVDGIDGFINLAKEDNGEDFKIINPHLPHSYEFYPASLFLDETVKKGAEIKDYGMSLDEKESHLVNIFGYNKDYLLSNPVMYASDNGGHRAYVRAISIDDAGNITLKASSKDYSDSQRKDFILSPKDKDYTLSLAAAYQSVREDIAVKVSELENKANEKFGKDFEFDYWNEDQVGTKVSRPDLGNMPDTILIDKISIKDGKLELISDDMGGAIDMSRMSFNDIEKISVSFDEVKTFIKQQEKENSKTLAPVIPTNELVEQFTNLKDKHPDAMLLFRTGDFYEVYMDDAKDAAKDLGLTMTKHNTLKEADGSPLRFAAFPCYDLDTYLPKLIRSGHRVAICDQLFNREELQKQAKGRITETVGQSQKLSKEPATKQVEKPEQEQVKETDVESTALFKDKKIWNLVIISPAGEDKLRQVVVPSPEDIDAFFKEAKGKTKDEVESLRDALGEKYLAKIADGSVKPIESRRISSDEKPSYVKQYAELMIAKIREMKEAQDKGDKNGWKKPWIGISGVPRSIYGNAYVGANNFLLSLYSEKMNYKVPIFATASRYDDLNFTTDKRGRKQPAKDENGKKLPVVHILKGEHSFPVRFTNVTFVNRETKEKISYKDYKQLSKEEREAYDIKRVTGRHNVFCIEQTNLKDARPELYKMLSEPYTMKDVTKQGQAIDFTPVDLMVAEDLWICPVNIKEGSDRAFFSLGDNAITLPAKTQFFKDEDYYSTMFHEMGHSTGIGPLHNRDFGGEFGSSKYAKEELVAELTAAIVASQQGMSKEIKEESAKYLSSWLDAIEADPDYLMNVLHDVDKASATINIRISDIQEQLSKGIGADYSEIREMNNDLRSRYAPGLVIAAAEPAPESELTVEEEEALTQEESQTQEAEEQRGKALKM